MILKRFRVTDFRSVSDSGWIDVEQITALIGTNESGKTNLLLPLWKLNPADEGEIVLTDDLPREKYHLYREASPKPVFISALYELLEDEKEELSKVSNHNPDEFTEIIVSKNYDNQLFWKFPQEQNFEPSIIDTAKNYLSTAKTSIEELKISGNKAESDRKDRAIKLLEKALSDANTIAIAATYINTVIEKISEFEDDVKTSLVCAAMSDLLENINNLLIESQKPKLEDNEEVIDYVKKHMPKYVYYSNYGNLDSQIYLPHVLNNIDRKDLGIKESAKARTLKTLFQFVKLDPKEITDLGMETTGTLSQSQIDSLADKKKEREILLASASSNFSKCFNEWWKQGNYTFEFQADGNFFRIWVSDSIRPERIELESRSTGLQWFFSFYLVFLVESNLHHQNAILLLDEPGVTLHPLAQKDLFMFFENLALNNQMLYTTHSPFMVDSNHLERVRSVYIDLNGKTVSSPDLRASEKLRGKNQSQSIYPAHAALGLTVSDSLLINCTPILVEGESDQVYLSALKNFLISKGKITPLKELVFISTGGVKGIKATSAILSATNEEKPTVILDGDVPGVKMATELKTDFYAATQDKVINISEFTSLQNGEIEDLLPKQKIAKVVAHFLPRPEDVEDEFDDVIVDDMPLCDQIERYAKANGIILEQG